MNKCYHLRQGMTQNLIMPESDGVLSDLSQVQNTSEVGFIVDCTFKSSAEMANVVLNAGCMLTMLKRTAASHILEVSISAYSKCAFSQQ